MRPIAIVFLLFLSSAALHAQELVVIEGLPENPIDGLRLTGIVGTGIRGLTASYATHLELSHVQMNVARGAPFRFSNTPELDTDHIESRRHPGDVKLIEQR